MKAVLILVVLIFPAVFYAQDDLDSEVNDEKAKQRIDLVVAEIEKKHEQGSHDSFIVRKKNYFEEWKYMISDENIEYFEINYVEVDKESSIKYSEVYYLQNNQLIHSTERLNFYTGESKEGVLELGASWSAEYYFKTRNLVYLMSNGHGKSESDDWEPEKETLATFNTRLKFLKSTF